jgi:hypothetical protein
MENFTIHIFNYGETQINSNEFSIKVDNKLISGTTEPLVDLIWKLKPTELVMDKKFNVIHVFNYDRIMWLGEKNFPLKDTTNIKNNIDNLREELKKHKKPI